MRIQCNCTSTSISLNIDAPTGIKLQESGAIQRAISEIKVANRSISGDIRCCMRCQLDESSDGRTGEVSFVEYTKCPRRNTRRSTSESKGADRTSIHTLILELLIAQANYHATRRWHRNPLARFS